MTAVSKHLQVGQTVRLEEQGVGYRVTLLAAGEAGQQVVEVGVDYVVLDDAGAGVSTRIPAHLVNAVTTATVEATPQAA